MPLRSYQDLMDYPQPLTPCAVCGKEPWQVIDHPTQPFEIRLCLPCFLQRQEQHKANKKVVRRQNTTRKATWRRLKAGGLCRHGANRNSEVLHIEHFQLTPADQESNRFASICPACNYGNLMVRRDRETLKLSAFDICLYCGQQVLYTDISDMRRKDWAGE